MTDWKDFTLAFPCYREYILLGRKTRHFAVGKLNGYGGEVEPGQTIREATVDELQKECMVLAKRLEYMAQVLVTYKGKREGVRLHVSLVPEFDGEPWPTDEMADPKWYPREDLPLEQMLPDSQYWLPEILQGQKVIAEFQYNNKQEFKILHNVITPVELLPDVYDRKAHKTLSTEIKE